jgi:mannose-6-phosphate isomerase-like protein (cupin superfamily)
MADTLRPIIRAPGEGLANAAFFPRVFRVTPEEACGAFAAWEEHVPAGAGPPLHIHHHEDEPFCVLSGRMLFQAGETRAEAGPGWTVFIPRGMPHAFRGLEASVALVTLTPGAGAGFFLDVEREGLHPPGDMPRIAEVAARYGLEFVGPPIGAVSACVTSAPPRT